MPDGQFKRRVGRGSARLSRQLAVLAPLFAGCCLAAVVHAGESDRLLSRPLPVHDLYPPLQRLYEPLPSSALEPYDPRLSVSILQSYSSIFQYDTLPDGDLLVDMELYTLEAILRRSISDSTELSLLIPLHYAHAGTLDAFLRDYHDALGLPNSGRQFRPDDVYGYDYQGQDGQMGWSDEAGWQIGNLQAGLRHGLYRDANRAVALLAGISLPTGDQAQGWGNGQPVVSIGGVGSWHIESWFGHLQAYILHPFADDYRDYARLALSLGYKFSDRWAVSGLVQGGNSPYRTSIVELDQSPWQLSLGARWLAGRSTAISLAFSEGITQFTAPDFTITAGIEFIL